MTKKEEKEEFNWRPSLGKELKEIFDKFAKIIISVDKGRKNPSYYEVGEALAEKLKGKQITYP